MKRARSPSPDSESSDSGESDDESEPEPASDEATEATEPPEPNSRKRTEPVDLGKWFGMFLGTRVRDNEYGTWRTVPGFSPDEVIVTDLGWVRTRAPCGKGFAKPTKGNQRTRGDYKVGVNSHSYLVHNLMLRAFRGPRRPGETGEHKNRIPSDTHLSNLKWATKKEQRDNQGKRKPQRTGQPIEVRRKDEPEAAWTWYLSSNAADKACGVQGLAHVANPNLPEKSCGVWEARWAEPLETQDDLPPDADYVDAKGKAKPQDAEEWRDAYYYDQLLPRWRVSNRGRAQTRHSRGNDWGHKFTPEATEGMDYAHIAGPKLFHVSVVSTFLGLTKGQLVDHIDQDKASNLLTNLRPATYSENALNVTKKPLSERDNSKKMSISARRPSWPATTPSREFESQNVAARELGVSQGAISKHLNGKRFPEGHKRAGKLVQPAPGGYVFHRIVEPTPWEEDWGPM
jgi:hypothetical protein